MDCRPLVFLALLVAVPQLRISYANSCVVDEPPRFTSDGQPPKAVLVDLQESGGNNLILPCEVTGTPSITVSWFRGDTMISQIILEDGERNCTLSIRVTEAEAPREGINHYCTATNRIGPVIEPESRTSATLRSRDVNVSSSFFGGFQNRETEVATIVNGEAALECAFNPSNPSPNVTWFANDLMITETSRIQYLEGGRYLHIQELTAIERGMRYHCEVNNFLDKNGMPMIAPTNYSLTRDIPAGTINAYISHNTMFGRIGEPVTLEFTAAARRPNGAEVVVTVDCPNNDLVIFGLAAKTTFTATLTEAARNKNQVDFTCELVSIATPISVTGTIIVSDPPNIANPRSDDPSLVDRERQVGGGEVSYLCEASSSSITWYFNGAEVQSGSNGVEVSSDRTRLTIREPQFSHSGIYQCFARNQFGDDSRAWILEVADPAIRMVTFLSLYKISVGSQGYSLLAPNNTTNLVVTAAVNFTRVDGLATCGSYPQVQWKFNGTNITNGSDYTVFSGDCTSSSCTFTLTIANLTAETTGNYSVVFTLLGVVRESLGLFITSSCISEITNIVQVEKPAYLEVRCRFFDIRPTTVSWSRGDTITSDTEQIDILPVMNGVSTLRISSMAAKDGDVYTCTTTSEGCGSDSRDITIDVQKSGGDSSDDGIRSIGGLVGGIATAVVGVLVVLTVQLFW